MSIKREYEIAAISERDQFRMIKTKLIRRTLESTTKANGNIKYMFTFCCQNEVGSKIWHFTICLSAFELIGLTETEEVKLKNNCLTLDE